MQKAQRKKVKSPIGVDIMTYSSSTSIPMSTAVLAGNTLATQPSINLGIATEKVNEVDIAPAMERKTKPNESREQKLLEAQETVHLVASLNAFVQLMDRNISFEVDTLSGRDVISVFDKETQVLIRQIPSEETLELLERMDKVVGVLFNKNV